MLHASAIPTPQATWLDKAIAWVSPEAGIRRMAARTVEASYRGGVATRTSESWPTAQGYRYGSASDRQEIIGTRNRAYHAYDNNLVARTLVQTETDNVIGDGLNYQATTDDEAWNREAVDRYYQWIDECSVRGGDTEDGNELQRNIWSYSRVAGDIGWILVNRDYVANNTLVVDSRVQVVRAHNLVTPDELQADPSVYDGIRFDNSGRPVTFYVMTLDDLTGVKRFAAIPARDFVWLPHMTKPGQGRPPSCYVTIFDMLANLDRYTDGVALAAWMATVMGIIFKQNSPSNAMGGLGSLTNSQGVSQKAVTFENGMVRYIGTEEEVAQVQAHQPMQQTPEFIRTMYRMLGQPFDMPLEVLAKDMSTCTFASARIGLLPFYRSCRIKAARFGSRWSRTIRWWLSRERMRGPNDPKRWRTPFPENYWAHELLVNAWDYTDPVNEAQSDQLQCDMGTKSYPMVMAERGRNGEKILRERRDWLAKTGDLPQTHSSLTRDPAPEPVEPVVPPASNGLPQDMVRALMADKTTREIIYNVADVPALLQDAGVKLDPSIDAADGEGLPLLPATEETTNE